MKVKRINDKIAGEGYNEEKRKELIHFNMFLSSIIQIVSRNIV
jgi:hypothetical protein